MVAGRGGMTRGSAVVAVTEGVDVVVVVSHRRHYYRYYVVVLAYLMWLHRPDFFYSEKLD